MAAPWSRVVNTTIRNYIREQEVNVLKNRKLLAMLKNRGRITYNWSGVLMDYKVQYRLNRPTPFADGDTVAFSRKNYWQTAALDWRGYNMEDAITKGEFLQNRGKEAIIKIFSSLGERLMTGMDEFFGEELYVNGYAAANAKRIHGIESFMAGTQQAANGNAVPTSTFAGLSCVPGAYNGSWTGTWPNGRGDVQYDFWSPVLVDYTNTLFPGNGGAVTWGTSCVEAISYGLIKSKKAKSKKGSIDLVLLDDELWRAYLTKQRTLQRIGITPGSRSSELVALGFESDGILNQDGCDITWEYGITPSVGYGFNMDMMELRSQQAQLFVPEGPDQDIASKSWRLSLDFFGNCVWNPKFFFKLAAYT